MIKPIKSKLEEIKKNDQGMPRKHIAVLGAGMAGLSAAYELLELGHDVTIYEAQSRVGGRAWTHRFKDEDRKEEDYAYHELGAMRFPINHDYTRYYAQKCGLQFRTFINHHDDGDAFYFFRGHLSQHRQSLEKMLTHFDLSQSDRDIIFAKGPIPADKAPEKALLNLMAYPFELLINEIMSDKRESDALLDLGPMTPRVREIDSLSLKEFLASKIESVEALELIGLVTGLECLWHKAVTMFLREEVVARLRNQIQGIRENDASRIDEIIGGTDLLPKEMLKKILAAGGNVCLLHEVLSIATLENGIQLKIKTDKGEEHELHYEHVICTIPFPVLRRMKLKNISIEKMRAIRNLGYTSSIKVLLYCKDRFWESENYNIKGGASQTDLINRLVFYPSNSIETKSDDQVESLMKSVAVQFQSYQSKKVINDQKAGGVLVGSYCWGADACRLGALSADERANVVIEAISNFHPEILEDGMVKGYASMYWDEFKWTAGAFCFMNPKDFSIYYLDSIKPEGRLYFAGEHCSLDNGWIQGSIISALEAVSHIVKT